jgi:hypothetical protein
MQSLFIVGKYASVWQAALETQLAYVGDIMKLESAIDTDPEELACAEVPIGKPAKQPDHLLPPYTAEKVRALNQWFDY